MTRQFTMHRPARRAAAKPSIAVRPARRVAPRRLDVTAGTAAAPEAGKVPETGGPEGPEPTRYGDWERKGICYDF